MPTPQVTARSRPKHYGQRPFLAPDSIRGPLMSLLRASATASMALRCCPHSISEPSLSLPGHQAPHRRPIDAVSSRHSPEMPGLSAEPTAEPTAGPTAGPSGGPSAGASPQAQPEPQPEPEP